jgi:hypothetical protein
MKKYCLSVSAVFTLLAFQIVHAQVKVKPKTPSFKATNFCSTIQPQKKDLPLDTSNSRAMADNYFLWDNGKVLTVKFMGDGGSLKLREKIKVAAKEWEKYANLTFNFVESGEANIRVLLTNKGGCNSVVGTNALFRESDEKTMNIDTNFFYQNHICYDAYLIQTIQHEFGHAIGLLHEHSYKGKIQWNKPVVYKEAYERDKTWDKAMVDFQIFMQYENLYTNGFTYDPLSIMHYGYPASWTLNNIEIKSNFKLSEMDKATVGLLYPKLEPRKNEFPRFVITNYTSSKVIKSNERQGLLIYPSFNLATSGRSGKLFLVAYLYNTDSTPVVKVNDPTKIVCKYIGLNVPSGLKVDFNKSGKLNYEIYLPFSEFPTTLKDYILLVRVLLIDDMNNETKYLAQDIVPSSQIK